MTKPEIYELICNRLQEAGRAKGAPTVPINSETAILGGQLAVDSLDLAGIVVELESLTGKDPFAGGFINFRTVGELTDLYAKPE